MVWIIIGVILALLFGVFIGAVIALNGSELDLDILLWILLSAIFLVTCCIGSGISNIEKNAKLEGVREYVENPQKYKVTRIPSRLEINYNDSIK